MRILWPKKPKSARNRPYLSLQLWPNCSHQKKVHTLHFPIFSLEILNIASQLNSAVNYLLWFLNFDYNALLAKCFWKLCLNCAIDLTNRHYYISVWSDIGAAMPEYPGHRTKHVINIFPQSFAVMKQDNIHGLLPTFKQPLLNLEHCPTGRRDKTQPWPRKMRDTKEILCKYTYLYISYTYFLD